MAGALRKTMVYLGLAEDDESLRRRRVLRGLRRAGRRPRSSPSDRGARASRHLQTPAAGGAVGALRRGGRASHRITTIHPRTYNEAKTIGENFRDGIPVIMNLTDMDDADAKRLVDFAAGLVFGLHGSIERVTARSSCSRPRRRGQRRGRPASWPGAASSTRADPTRVRVIQPDRSDFVP